MVHGGKREARHALDRLAAEVAEGRHARSSATVGHLLDEWMTRYVERRRARTTIDTYRVHVDKHIRPALGSVRLAKLTAYDLDRYFESLEAKGLSPATIRLNPNIVSGALSQAVKWDWIRSNPATRSSAPEVRSAERRALTVAELRTLYWAAHAEDIDMAAAIAVAALSGCRRGELCGLRWRDVDWDRACMRVERAWVPIEGGQHLTTTKTGKVRTVYLGDEGLELLRQYRGEKREQLGYEPDPAGWLISLDGGETPIRAKTVTEYVSRLGRRLGIPVHLHALRHFAATELVHAGVDLPTAAGQLGHTVEVMASTYLHTESGRGAAAGKAIAAVVGQALAVPIEVEAELAEG